MDTCYIRLPYRVAGYVTGRKIKQMSNITQMVRKEKHMATLNKAVIAAGWPGLPSTEPAFTHNMKTTNGVVHGLDAVPE